MQRVIVVTFFPNTTEYVTTQPQGSRSDNGVCSVVMTTPAHHGTG
ncbi:MAG: hypothetical protein PSX37_03010 [bacterium]|nr:hypothetical protein [bacterium]